MTTSPALLSAVRRIAAENGLTVSEGAFTVPSEAYGAVFELEDGSKVFVERGQKLPDGFKTATSVWCGDPGVHCAETSPEVLEIAGRGMSDPKSLTPEEIQSVCASCVAQAPKPAAD